MFYFARVASRTLSLALAGSLAALAGCAAREEPRPRVPDEPVIAYERARGPACSALAGSTSASWYSREPGESWVEEGSHFLVCRSGLFGEVELDGGDGAGSERTDAATDVDGSRGRDRQISSGALTGAREEALRQAYAFAFERLEARGVGYEDRRLEEMIHERAAAHSRGEEVTFPRIAIADSVEEQCSVAPWLGDFYRASLLAEYPISNLRGDVNNATWRAKQVTSEASVLVSSARSFLEEGRWFDALVGLARARELLDAVSREARTGGLARQVEALLEWADGSLTVEPLAGPLVLEAGERRTQAIDFFWTYEWEGKTIPAVGLPVSFTPHGFAAVSSSDPETDDSGIATCRIQAAFGPPGEHSLEPGLDLDVVSEALGDAYAGTRGPSEPLRHQVFLVEGTHALSVCVEIEGLDSADEAQFEAGFARRLESDGFLLEECGPEVDIVVRAVLDKRVAELEDGQVEAVVDVDATAFDQRVAQEIGSPEIATSESGADVRDSEVIALKEAGRLLAAYLYSRAMLSGS